MKKFIFSGLVLALLMPVSALASFDTSLKYGASGPAVKELQEFLTDQGIYSGPITGNFYSLTLKAVKSFQTAQNITPVSGFFGPMTRAKASSLLDIAASDEAEKNETGSVTTPITDDKMAQLLALIAGMKTATENQTQAIQQQAKPTQQTSTNTTQPIPVTPVQTAPQINVLPNSVDSSINSSPFDQKIASFILNSSTSSLSITEIQVNLSGDIEVSKIHGLTLVISGTNPSDRKESVDTINKIPVWFPVNPNTPRTIDIFANINGSTGTIKTEITKISGNNTGINFYVDTSASSTITVN